MTANPFRQPQPARRDVRLRTRLWAADSGGKDQSSGHPIRVLASESFLFLGSDFSVPLAWLTRIEAAGKGMHLEWSNRLNGQVEGAYFCIRTMFGYNTKARDALLVELRALSRAAAAQADPRVSAASIPLCESCGSSLASQRDLTWVASVLLYLAVRPERRVYCQEHAARRLRFIVVTNIAISALGVPGMVVMPVLNFRQAKENRDLLPTSGPSLILAASLLPVLAVLSLVAWSLLS